MTLSFGEKCYRLSAKVPKGKVTTYKEIAKAMGTKAYRAVGNAMKKNPYAPKIPCHRVIKTNGNIGGFVSGIGNKIRLLKSEGVEIINNKINLNKYLYKFKLR